MRAEAGSLAFLYFVLACNFGSSFPFFVQTRFLVQSRRCTNNAVCTEITNSAPKLQAVARNDASSQKSPVWGMRLTAAGATVRYAVLPIRVNCERGILRIPLHIVVCRQVTTKRGIERLADGMDIPPLVYANVVQITPGPFDLIMDFGFKTPEQTQHGSTEYESVVRVAMSLAHAKTMVPILANVIAQYEQQIGPITAPGFDDSAKE